MKKKFLYIFWLALLISVLSLLIFIPQYQHMCDPVACQPVPDSRGFPLKVPLGPYRYVDGSTYRQSDDVPLIVYQAKAIVANTFFYFLIFSAIYFAYSKLTRKSNKK